MPATKSKMATGCRGSSDTPAQTFAYFILIYHFSINYYLYFSFTNYSSLMHNHNFYKQLLNPGFYTGIERLNNPAAVFWLNLFCTGNTPVVIKGVDERGVLDTRRWFGSGIIATVNFNKFNFDVYA